jgi:hypothetical protein
MLLYCEAPPELLDQKGHAKNEKGKHAATMQDPMGLCSSQ